MNTNSELVAGRHYILGRPMYLVHVSITYSLMQSILYRVQMMALFALFWHAKSVLPKPVGPLSMAAPVFKHHSCQYSRGKNPVLTSKHGHTTTSLPKRSAERKCQILDSTMWVSSFCMLISLTDSNYILMLH